MGQSDNGPWEPSPLAFEVEWRKLKIEINLEEELEEEMDWIISYFLE